MSSTAVIRTLALAFLTAAPLAAQERNPDQVLASEQYERPPAAIERLVTAPRHLNVTFGNQSPERRQFLRLRSAGLPTVRDFGKPWHNLAGLQIDPRANRARTLTTRINTGLEII